MSAQSNILALRAKIARRLDTSSLPVAGRHKTFGGRGNNEICDCCDGPIGPGDVLYEVEVKPAEETLILAMHPSCFDVWIEESRAKSGAVLMSPSRT